jgi:hypothetical protein
MAPQHAEWQRLVDAASHAAYFRNTVTGESVWSAEGGSAAGVVGASSARLNVWRRCVDAASGCSYFVNDHTGESEWAHDDGGDGAVHSAAWVLLQDAGSGAHYLWCAEEQRGLWCVAQRDAASAAAAGHSSGWTVASVDAASGCTWLCSPAGVWLAAQSW